jgi:hypothetical protein
VVVFAHQAVAGRSGEEVPADQRDMVTLLLATLARMASTP